MKTKIGKSVKSNVRRSVWGSEDNSVSNPVYYSVWRLVCNSVDSSIYSLVSDSVTPSINIRLWWTSINNRL